MQRQLMFEWWTPEQAAAALQVSADHVRDLCRRGKLSGKIERRRWWIDPSSVARYLAKREEANGGS